MGTKDTIFSKKTTINCNGSLLDLAVPKVMGVLNVTPDSFYDGGYYENNEQIQQQVLRLIGEGADMIDVGGYSSRPGAEQIPVEDELSRLRPVLEQIRKNYPEVILSVDTFRSEVARIAVEEYQVDIINDISGGELDGNMFETIADLQVPYIMMHMKGTPQNMKEKAHYEDMMKEITAFFSQKTDQLKTMGVHDLILDPGFGFAKNVEQNYQLLNQLEQLRFFDLPILAGLSRKSMIYKLLNIEPREALNGTTVLNTVALEKGADILRVHDVKEAKQAIHIIEKMKETR